MCWKKQVINWEHSNKVALLFGINDWPGSQNDLDFCINDIDLVQSKLPADFQIRRFVNSEVTRKRFKDELIYAINNSIAGDIIYLHYSGHGSRIPDVHGDETDGYDETLYLYDGNLCDDDTGAILQTIPEGVIVVIFLDSCFSGTATRNPHKVRFMPPKKYFPARVRVKKVFNNELNYLALSGCSESETSGEGVINGIGNGAATRYFYDCLSFDYTWQKWHGQVRLRLPNKDFPQSPQIEGKEDIANRLVFS
jgi:hypothetical protein